MTMRNFGKVSSGVVVAGALALSISLAACTSCRETTRGRRNTGVITGTGGATTGTGGMGPAPVA